MSRPIRWLHLSDIHMGQRGLEVWHQVQSEFKKSLKSELQDIGAPDLILFTGDFAFSGKPDEYALVDSFLDSLLADIRSVWKEANPALIPVPGNHDVCWPESSSEEFSQYAIFDFFAENTGDNIHVKAFNKQLWSGKTPSSIENLFSGYLPWFKRRIDDLKANPWIEVSTGRIPGDLTVLLDIPDTFPVCVVGLNSSWLQYSSGDFEKKLAVTTEQFHAALPSTGNSNPLEVFEQRKALLLMHHPPSWLEASRAKSFYNEIFRPERFSVCLYGHMHMPTSRSTTENAATSLTTFQAPSLCGLEKFGTTEEERAFGYVFGQMDKEGVIKVHPFKRDSINQHGFLWDQTFGSQKENINGAIINPAVAKLAQQSQKEYKKRIKETEQKDNKARKNIVRGKHEELFADVEESVRIFIARGDLRDSYSDIIVSSDDTNLSSEGGIAQKILESAGNDIQNEIDSIRKFGIPHGHIAVTNAGRLPFRAIFHAAVVDKRTYKYQYPAEKHIRGVVRHSLSCANAFGSRGIAFPVLGGGTGAKAIRPWDSISWILSEFFSYAWKKGKQGALRELVLCVYSADDVSGNLDHLVRDLRNQKEK